MKPQCLCLVNMGPLGLNLVRAYPDILPEEEIRKISIKSMPLGAKEGDFTTNTVDNSVISGYIFSIPSETERDNIGSLVAVFNSMDYKPKVINQIFAFTITELKKHNLVSTDSISQILPSLYEGIVKGELKIKVSSVVTLEMSFGEDNTDNKKDKFQSFGDDIWK
ncbi:MAG: hypothetical protein ACFFDW_17230 [Candidatus Thorarchaeota archaeon]